MGIDDNARTVLAFLAEAHSVAKVAGAALPIDASLDEGALAPPLRD